MKVGAPARTAARAWLAPLPPSTIEKVVPDHGLARARQCRREDGEVGTDAADHGDAGAVSHGLDTTASFEGQPAPSSATARMARVLEPMTAADEASITAQLQRPPRGVAGIAYRCPCGQPAVVATRPRLADGTPFPTTYYLTCPRATAACSTLEAEGLMAR